MEFLLLAICIGVIPGFIAQSKGRSFVAWWLYGAALFIVALPHSLIMKADQEEIEREQLDSGNSKRCPFCAEIIKKQAVVCRFCGRDLPANTSSRRTDVSDKFRHIAERYSFVNAGPEGQSETWWGANNLGTSPAEDHNLYLMLQNSKWRLGSSESHIADRIRRICGHLSLEDSADIKMTETGITGDRTDSLSAALQTYKLLASE